MAGRQSWTETSRARNLAPIELRKDGAQTVATVAQRFYNQGETPLRIAKVRATVGTAPTGSALTVDVKVSGTSVFNVAGDRVYIPAGSNASAEFRPTKTDADAVSVKPGQYLQVDVTGVGSTVAGSDLVVQVYTVPV